MGNGFKAGWLGFVLILASFLAFGAERSFLFYTEYPNVMLSPDRELSLDVILQNLGPDPETVLLKVDGPTNWNARFETSSYPVMQIGAVYLLPDPEKKDDRQVQSQASYRSKRRFLHLHPYGHDRR